MEHPRFANNCELCAAIHYTFIRYTSERSRTRGYNLRRAILVFLDFLIHYESKNPVELRVDSLECIDIEVFRSFELYVQKIQEKSSLVPEFKTALTIVARSYDEEMPLLILPMVDRPSYNKTEPLDENCRIQLEAAFQTHIDKLYNKLEFRKLIDQTEPYTIEQIIDEIYSIYNRKNIFQLIQYYIENSNKDEFEAIRTRRIGIQRILAICKDDENLCEISKLGPTHPMVRALLKYYHKEATPFLLKKPILPFSSAKMPQLYNWVPDLNRVLKTLIVNNHPFNVPLETLKPILDKCQNAGFDIDKNYMNYVNDHFNDVECNSRALLLIYRYFTSKKFTAIRLAYNKKIKHDDQKVKMPNLNGLLEMYYPRSIDQTAILLFIMYQTGWNKETVMALDKDNYEDKLIGGLWQNNTIIFSEKERGQSNHLNYYNPKTIRAISAKDDKYSALNLIRLALDLSSPLIELPKETILINYVDTYNPIFLAIRKKRGWTNNGGGCSKSEKAATKLPGRFTSIGKIALYTNGVKAFFKKYPIYENGKQLREADDIRGRLRPTWFAINKEKKNIPLILLQMLQGHTDIETTDVFYDSSAYAMKERYKRLGSELEAVMELFLQKKFKGIIGKKRDFKKEKLTLRLFIIPSNNVFLWACTNSFKPDWQGSEYIIRNGTKCSSIHKCLFCSRSYICEESLPVLMERLAVIQDRVYEDNFKNNIHLLQEIEIIDEIIDNWDDDFALLKAARYHRNHRIVLPNDMQSLSIFFED